MTDRRPLSALIFASCIAMITGSAASLVFLIAQAEEGARVWHWLQAATWTLAWGVGVYFLRLEFARARRRARPADTPAGEDCETLGSGTPRPADL